MMARYLILTSILAFADYTILDWGLGGWWFLVAFIILVFDAFIEIGLKAATDALWQD